MELDLYIRAGTDEGATSISEDWISPGNRGENQDALLRLKAGFSRATFSRSSFETRAGGQPGLPEKPVRFPVCPVGKEAAEGL